MLEPLIADRPQPAAQGLMVNIGEPLIQTAATPRSKIERNARIILPFYPLANQPNRGL